MKLFTLFGLVGLTPKMLISVQAEDVLDAARKLRGKCAAPVVRSDKCDVLGSYGVRAQFHPDADGGTAKVIADWKCGIRHDPIEGNGSNDNGRFTAEQEEERLRNFTWFLLCECACVR
jgi:hypothetical protein